MREAEIRDDHEADPARPIPTNSHPMQYAAVRGNGKHLHSRDTVVDAGVMTDCAFCDIASGTAPARVVRRWPDALAIRPRGGGCTDGHLLVLPTAHVADAAADPAVTASAMARAAELAAGYDACNIITSRGAAATQTVFHLHLHVVPRYDGDNLSLPWPTQER